MREKNLSTLLLTRLYVSGKMRGNKIFYKGFTLRVFDNFSNIDGFEKNNWYMQSVDDETVMELIEMVKKYMVMA